MDYIDTNLQGTANAPNGMSYQLLGTWFQPGFPFLGTGHCAILPWPHVRNQEKRFPREHFAFAREQTRFARKHFAFAREEKRFAREHFAFAREEKRFAREHFAFAREEKRFAREHFTFAHEEKRFAREHFAFARQEKRFARDHFAFAREQTRFPRCRRTGVVFRRSVHPPADPSTARRNRIGPLLIQGNTAAFADPELVPTHTTLHRARC